jgi:dTDP-glucose 4,6-dehydratase
MLQITNVNPILNKQFDSTNEVILVTGGCGFIGSHFIEKYLKENPNRLVINLDLLTYAGSLDNSKNFDKLPNYKFIYGDIQNFDLINYLINTYNIKCIVNFAAESHVDNSIRNPNPFFSTNVNGTLQLLKAAYNNWMVAPHKYKHNIDNYMFLHISTDEVYGTLEFDDKKLFNESSKFKPTSPYAASKASSELIAIAFSKTYGLKLVITNCSNNYGPRQHEEKLIPHVITRALNNKSINIHGNGRNMRDWIYVSDHCDALISLFKNNSKSYITKYNIGANNEFSNLDIVHMICTKLDHKRPSQTLSSYKSLIKFVTDRPANDLRYAVNCRKIHNCTGWKAKTTIDKGLDLTIEWYIKKLLE